MVTITLYAKQKKRHRCIEQSFRIRFFCKRGTEPDLSNSPVPSGCSSKLCACSSSLAPYFQPAHFLLSSLPPLPSHPPPSAPPVPSLPLHQGHLKGHTLCGIGPESRGSTRVPEPPQPPVRTTLHPRAPPPPLSLRPASSSGSRTLV